MTKQTRHVSSTPSFSPCNRIPGPPGWLLFAILVACAPGAALGAVLQGNPSNYRSLVGTLQPGDVLVLAPGTYSSGLTISGRHGAPGTPIVITGPASGEPAVFTGRSCCNTIQIENASHIEIRHLKLDGLGIGGIDGVNGRGATHDITIANFHIVGHGGGQQTNGISTKGPAWNWVIRDSLIEGAGTGMYLGDSDGGQPFVNGLVERNVMLGTIGYNMQVKHQNPRPTGIGMPTGASRTIIRHNVFSKSTNSSTGGNARPNLLVGHLPRSGAGVDDVYEIYGNFFYQNPSEALFQGEGNIALYGNLFVNDTGTAVAVQPHNDVPRRVLIFRNTVVAGGTGIRLTGGAAGHERRVFANAVFAGTPLSASNADSNVTGSRASAADHLRNPLAALGALDLSPLAGALDGAALDFSAVAGFSDSQLDFESHPYAAAGQRGAYASAATWLPRLARKPEADEPPSNGGDGDGNGNGDGNGGNGNGNGGGGTTAPYQPALNPPGNQPAGEALIPNTPYQHPDGGALAAAEWEIASEGLDRIVLRRKVDAPGHLRIPQGVLRAGERYAVRLRHENSLQQVSEWSDRQLFEAEPWNDADSDGTHDLYQEGTQTDPMRCALRHPRSGAVEFAATTPGSAIRCVGIVETAGGPLPSPVGVAIGGDGVPYGFFALRVEGLTSTQANPAQTSVVAYLPRDMDAGGRWFEHDETAGALVDYSRFATGLAATSRQVMVSVTDGGRGDLDGVVNGVIVMQSGLVTAAAVQQIGSGGAGGNGGSTGDAADGGGGAFSLPDAALCLLMYLFLAMRHAALRRLPPPSRRCTPSSAWRG